MESKTNTEIKEKDNKKKNQTFFHKESKSRSFYWSLISKLTTKGLQNF
jgi:hypothetical protein